MTHRSRATGPPSPAAGLICLCLLAAGCGTSGTPRHAAGSRSFSAQQLAFAKCMRGHGVSGFPDPGTPASGPANSIGGIQIPTTINLQSPTSRAAEQACQGEFSAALSQQGKPPISARMKAALIAQAQCMREHGVPNLRDPTFPPGGGIEVTDEGTDPASPAYKHAQAVCAH